MAEIVGQTDNRIMSRAFLAALLACVAACSPPFDWREMTLDPSGLHVTFPCKPDRAERKASITPGREIVLHAIGCETGGASFVVVYGDSGSGAEVAGALSQWRQASLAAARATLQGEQAFVPAGALGLPASAMVRASGQRTDGSAVQSQSAYFARGATVFQVAVYATTLKPEMTEPFFTGLRFE